MRRFFPTPWLTLILILAALDLATTLYWHSRGMMVELNPLMRPLLEIGPMHFALAKTAGMVALWLSVALYFGKNPTFCRRACAVGAYSYGAIWAVWTVAGNS